MYNLVEWNENGKFHEELLSDDELMNMLMEEEIELIRVKPL